MDQLTPTDNFQKLLAKYDSRFVKNNACINPNKKIVIGQSDVSKLSKYELSIIKTIASIWVILLI